MSQENVELVLASFDAWNRNDWDALEATYAPDAVAVAPDGWPEAETTHGWEKTRRQYERIKDSWESEHVEVVEIRDLGDRVLARFRWVTQGKASGIETEVGFSGIGTCEAGRIKRFEFFLDHAKALEAAGLAE